ncbi:MAG: methyltransferase [Alphaproteobacteria bacterium]|nr:methyltransferase [Alphaproteobacteria bacterium]
MSTTRDALLGGRVTLLQPRRGYRVAVDAVLLAAATAAGAGDSVLDLGAGVGAVGLCLAARVPACRITCLDVQPALSALAQQNIDANGFGDRMGAVTHDIAQPLPAGLGPFDRVATNPPYLAAAVADPSPDPIKALATVESSADLARWLAVATGALKPDGTLTIVHRADRLQEIAGHLARLGWGELAVKRLPPAPRVLIRARPGTKLDLAERAPLVLHRPDGGYTDEAEAVLRGAAAIDF